MKKIFADKRDFKDISVYDFNCFRIEEDFFQGYIAGINVFKEKRPFLLNDERFFIDDNCFCLEIYPFKKNYCIMSIFDNNDQILEWYINIIKKTGIEKNIPYEDSLYLNIKISLDGTIQILNQQELEDAYINKIITKNEYILAFEIAKKIVLRYSANISELEELTNNLNEKYHQLMLSR